MAIISRVATRYRTSGLPSGALRKLDGLHVHVDGGGSYELVLEAAKELEASGHASKVATISRSIAGPERKRYPQTYASHTPPGGEDALEYFSTSAIRDRNDGVQLLKRLLERFRSRPGTVIEAEHVVATVENGVWSQVALDDLPCYLEQEIGFKKNVSLPFEIHHAFDVPGDVAATLDIRQLMSETNRLGLLVGGWFAFDRGNGDQSFRSNSFRQRAGLREQVLLEHELLDGYLMAKRVDFRLWTIVEQVMGIWRTPLQEFKDDSVSDRD